MQLLSASKREREKQRDKSKARLHTHLGHGQPFLNLTHVFPGDLNEVVQVLHFNQQIVVWRSGHTVSSIPLLQFLPQGCLMETQLKGLTPAVGIEHSVFRVDPKRASMEEPDVKTTFIDLGPLLRIKLFMIKNTALNLRTWQLGFSYFGTLCTITHSESFSFLIELEWKH